MSNLTTAGNLSVSQNITVGGNLSVSGNLVPSGNIVMTGTFTTTSYANFSGDTSFTGNVFFATGKEIYLNSTPLYISGVKTSFLLYEIGEDKIQLAGNQGGSLGHSNTGVYKKLITWNTSDYVGINTTTPAYTLDVNGNANISGNTGLGNITISGDISSTSGGNVYIGNTATSLGQLIVQSGIPATAEGTGALIVTGGANVSGNLIVSSSGIFMANSTAVSTSSSTGAITTKGGIGVLGNVNVAGYIASANYLYANRILPNSGQDIRLYTNSSNTVFINNDSTGALRFNTGNGVGSSYFDNGSVFVGNTTTGLGQLIVQSGIATTTLGTGALIVSGGTSVNGNLFVAGNITSSSYINSQRFYSYGNDLRLYTGMSGSTLYINNDSDGSIIFNDSNTSGISIFRNGNVYVGNTTSGSGQLVVTSGLDATAGGTGALVVNGGVSISKNLIVSSSGTLMANSSAVSTSTSTGAITCKGGVGISGNIYIGLGANIAGNVNIGGAHGFTYTTLPTFGNTQVGYTHFQTNTVGTLTPQTFTLNTSVIIPIGVYSISVLFAFQNGAVGGTLTFGLMTSTGVFNTTYNAVSPINSSATYANTMNAVINQGTAGVQYYGFTNTQNITSGKIIFTLVRIA